MEAQKQYDIVFTSMHWHLLEFYDSNHIDYYLAYPTLDSEEELVNRCIQRGNNQTFIDKYRINLRNGYMQLKNYHPKKILMIEKNQYLEDILRKENILK